MILESLSQKIIRKTLILLVILLVSCTGQLVQSLPTLEIPTLSATLIAIPETTPSPQPSRAPTKQASPIPHPKYSVYNECNLAQQAAAMQPDQIPDWQNLDINACYTLHFNLLPDQNEYSGSEILTYKNNSGRQQNDIVMRTYPNAANGYGGSLIISKASIDGQMITPQELLSDQTAVRIQPESPIPANSTVQIQFEFSGKIPQDFNSKDVYGIFGWSNPGPVIALSDWFPILAGWENNDWVVSPVLTIGDAVVSNSALYRVDISLPDAWKMASTGSEISTNSAAGVTTHHYVSGPVRDFAVAASPSFTVQEEQVNNIRIRFWGLPDTENSWAKALSVAKNSIISFSKQFGVYPYSELDIVTVPLQNADGDEFPGLVFTRSGLYINNGSSSYFSTVISHEISHQWWYGVVGSDVLNSPWQDESLATFSALLYFDQYSPSEYAGMLTYYNQRLSDFEKTNGKMPVSESVSDFSNNDRAYTIIIYFKGSLFLVELRKKLGDELFFKALQTYYQKNQYTLTQPTSLLSTFQQTCGCDLSDLYHNWGLTTP
jgi:hypothetical protein